MKYLEYCLSKTKHKIAQKQKQQPGMEINIYGNIWDKKGQLQALISFKKKLERNNDFIRFLFHSNKI